MNTPTWGLTSGCVVLRVSGGGVFGGECLHAGLGFLEELSKLPEKALSVF